jgi:hypothetical protein
MGSAHAHMIAPPEEYEEEPVKNQVHHRHKVLNEIKKTKASLRVTIPENTEQPITPPSKVYNKYKRKRSDTPPPPIFFNK